MPEKTSYAAGAPCWADMATPDLEAATRFYTGLFGWTANPVPGSGGTYNTMTLDGREVCAVFAMPEQRRAAGERPAWLVYLNVPDVREAAARVPDLGGQVLVPVYDVPAVGSMALISDPTGGPVALWQAGGHIGARVWGDPGAMAWNELATRDREAAAVFFAQLLGVGTQDLEGGSGYTMLTGPDHPVAGILQMNELWPQEIPPHWMTYFSVIDTDEAAVHVDELGGSVEVPPFDTPFGRISVVADPVGGYFSLVSPAVQDEG